MVKTLRTLEARYSKELRAIARRHGISQALPEEFPALLEKTTMPNLHSSRTWFVSGISGSGKSTIVQILTKAKYDRLRNVVTRPKRPEESPDDCVFTDTHTFLRWRREGLLFHPHKTNGVWHAILKRDLRKLAGRKYKLYADKSIRSTLVIVKEFPRIRSANFLYILPPTFSTLYTRLTSREKRKWGPGLSTQQIKARLEEEIIDMERTKKLPYVFIVNDSRSRVSRLIHRVIRSSK